VTDSKVLYHILQRIQGRSQALHLETAHHNNRTKSIPKADRFTDLFFGKKLHSPTIERKGGEA
jgi:hypothetical protein